MYQTPLAGRGKVDLPPGLLVQREDSWFAPRELRFESVEVHCSVPQLVEGSASEAGCWEFESPQSYSEMLTIPRVPCYPSARGEIEVGKVARPPSISEHQCVV